MKAYQEIKSRKIGGTRITLSKEFESYYMVRKDNVRFAHSWREESAQSLFRAAVASARLASGRE